MTVVRRPQLPSVQGRVAWDTANSRDRILDLGPIVYTYMEKPSNYTWPTHHHPNQAEYYYVDKGTVNIILRGKRFRLEQGQGVLHFPGQGHSVQGDRELACNVLVIHFSAQAAEKMVPGLRAITGQPLSHGSEEYRLVAELARRAHNGGRFVHLYVGAILTEFLVEMVESRVVAPGDSVSGIRPPRTGLAGRVESYVKANYGRPLKLSQIAREMHCSVSSLSHRYLDDTGETPHHLLIRCRVERAKELLRQHGLPVNRIANESGFTSAVSLIRAFRTLEKTTPGAYRRMLLG